jgi:hypothetical protein
MTDLTPTPNQLQSWIDKICYPYEQGVGPSLKDKELACLAFKAGADQELEACCHEVQDMYGGGSRLRAARRPEPPTLKEQALATLEVEPKDDKELIVFDTDQVDIIRRALEAIND